MVYIAKLVSYQTSVQVAALPVFFFLHSGLETLTPRMIRVLPTTGRSTLWAAVDIVPVVVLLLLRYPYSCY